LIKDKPGESKMTNKRKRRTISKEFKEQIALLHASEKQMELSKNTS